MYQKENGIYYREVKQDEPIESGEDRFRINVNMHGDKIHQKKFYLALPHNNNSWVYHLVNHWNRWPGFQYHVEGKVV